MRYPHALLLSPTAGNLYMWGGNAQGEVGISNTVHQHQPGGPHLITAQKKQLAYTAVPPPTLLSSSARTSHHGAEKHEEGRMIGQGNHQLPRPWTKQSFSYLLPTLFTPARDFAVCMWGSPNVLHIFTCWFFFQPVSSFQRSYAVTAAAAVKHICPRLLFASIWEEKYMGIDQGPSISFPFFPLTMWCSKNCWMYNHCRWMALFVVSMGADVSVS